MPIQYSAQPGAITKDTYIDTIDKAIDVIWMRKEDFVGNTARFFDVDNKQNGLTHVITNVGSEMPLPQRNEDTDGLPYATPAPGYKKTFTVLNRRLGIRVTRTAISADRFDVIVGMAQGTVKASQQSDEYERVSIFDNAFTGTDGADSKALCANDHPAENPTAADWDNLGTGALTGPNLQALRLVSRQMTNAIGRPQPVIPADLLVPNALEQKALELTSPGQGKPEGSLNEPNVLLPGLNVVVNDYLSSATAYWLVGDLMGPAKGLHEVVLDDWEMANNSPANVDIVIDKRIRGVKVFGFTTSRNICGSDGT